MKRAWKWVCLGLAQQHTGDDDAPSSAASGVVTCTAGCLNTTHLYLPYLLLLLLLHQVLVDMHCWLLPLQLKASPSAAAAAVAAAAA
jgi:hypothetical protein